MDPFAPGQRCGTSASNIQQLPDLVKVAEVTEAMGTTDAAVVGMAGKCQLAEGYSAVVGWGWNNLTVEQPQP